MKQYLEIIEQGLWHKNPALVQMLGLCPLLAVSNSVVNALGLSLATIFVLVGSSFIISAMRYIIPPTMKLPLFVMIIATLTTCSELIMRAFTLELYNILGIFIPLIVTNCMILGRAEVYASRQPVHLAVLDALFMSIGFSIVLIFLGGIREIIGNGTLFNSLDLILGESAANWQIKILDRSFILMALPPGAFIALGFLMAGKKSIDNFLEARKQKYKKIRSKRIRTTEIIN